MVFVEKIVQFSPNYDLKLIAAEERCLLPGGLIEGVIKPDNELIECIDLCTTCGYCQYRCALNNVEIIESLRSDLVNMGYENKYHRISAKNIMDYNNPFKESNKNRSKWSEGLPISKKSNILFFGGCVYPYLQPNRLKKIYESLIKIGLELNYLGENETCCGGIIIYNRIFRKFS